MAKDGYEDSDEIAELFNGVRDIIRGACEVLNPAIDTAGQGEALRVEENNFRAYRVGEPALRRGSVIFVNRGLYKHYGIYNNDQSVIHFSPDGRGTQFGKNISAQCVDLK
jgi:hypothetical protein